MRHLKSSKKLGRTSQHRKALVAALVCGLIKDKRITTTLPKAKIARQSAERMVTLARKGTLAARRQAIARLGRPEVVKELFDSIVPRFEGRSGGYTRIIKIGHRTGDGADVAVLEWVGSEATAAPAESEQAGA